MTNALAQNIKIEDNTAALDMLMQAANVSSEAKTQENQGFSNIINNLDSRFQKAQNEFDKKAKVTNTSSINQKALNKKEAKEIETIKTNVAVEKNVKETNKNAKVVQQDVKQSTNETSETTELVKKEITSEDENLSKEVKKDTSNNNSQNLSDINNSSPVESSPVFSSDKNKEIIVGKEAKVEVEKAVEEIEIEVEKLVSALPLVDETIKVETKDTKVQVENLFETQENLENVIQKIEQISAELNNSNLSQEQKEDALNVLNELKDLLSNTDENVKIKDFKNLLDEFKNLVDTELNSENIEIKELVSEVADDLKNLLNKDFLNTFEKPELKEDSIKIENDKEIIDEIKVLTKDIKEFLENIDTKELPKLTEKLDEIIKKIEDNFESNQSEFSEKLVDSLKNLQNVLKEQENLSFSFEKVEPDFALPNVFETLDKISNKEIEKIDLADKESMNEILNVFNDLSTQVEDLKINDEIKAEIENKIQDLVREIKDNVLSKEQLSEAIDSLSDEIKIEVEKEEISIQQIDNTLDTTINADKLSNNEQNLNKDTSKESDFDFQNQEVEIDFPEITEENIQPKEINLKSKISTDDIQEVEQNLQKTVALDNIMDEMMVEVDIKTIPSQSGALSVADEVAKLAMGENSSLNPVTSVHGSISYDPFGANAIIKNAATLMKTAQVQNANTPSMEDVLNQVTNKITQLKDGATQKLTMVLRPNDLGRLQIELNTNQNGLSTHIIAQNEDVRAYIERNIDSLRQQLSDAGVNVNSIQIKTAGSEGSTNYDGNQNFQREHNQENLNQQNNQQNNQKNNNKNANDIMAQMNNYDMQFAKDFSSVLNKTLNYNLN